MKNYIHGLIGTLLFTGCVGQHQINIGDISLQRYEKSPLKNQEYYMSFTQEYHDNKLYPLNQYCSDQRSYLADDKFSTETYLKITNERTNESRVGKYPIWFLLNDDSSNIYCTKKSANFINEEPFVVSDHDKLSLKLLQKNEAQTSVPVQELGVLIDLVSLVVPNTANFLMGASNIINDPVTKNYLNLMDESFKNGDLDGTKNRDFKTDVESIKVKLYVPQETKVRELGYILLKPKYRTTLSTVALNSGIPNFRYIYNSSDPRIQNLMQYQLKNRKIPVQVLVDNFKQVAQEHIIDALSSLNSSLVNRFTKYDRALILTLALRQSDFYRGFVHAVQTKNVALVKSYLSVLNQKQNPLLGLTEALKLTQLDYYGVMYQAQTLLKKAEATAAAQQQAEVNEQEARQREALAMQNIETLLSPVSTWQYLPEMFTPEVEIFTTRGRELNVSELTAQYNREDNVSDYGCYVALQKPIQIFNTRSNQKQQMSIQNYLIHPNYTRGIQFDYMALSVDKQNRIDTIFYKLSKENRDKISKILIDKGNLLIGKRRIREIIKGKRAYECSENIKGLLQ